MSRTRGITETGFEDVVPYFKSLKYLNMGSSSAVSDQTISALAVYCTQLECLKLFGCRQLTDVAIITLAQNCTRKCVGWCNVGAVMALGTKVQQCHDSTNGAQGNSKQMKKQHQCAYHGRGSCIGRAGSGRQARCNQSIIISAR